MNATMEGLKAAWPHVTRFIKELESEGVDDETLRIAIDAGLASVNSGGYLDARLVTSDKIVRFRETVMAICFAARPADLAAFRVRVI